MRESSLPATARANPAIVDYRQFMRTTLEIQGMSCVNCVRAVVTGLGGVPGVTGADVKIGQAVVDHGPHVTIARLREAIEVAGYKVKATVEERRRLPIL
jgi:copper chaperone